MQEQLIEIGVQLGAVAFIVFMTTLLAFIKKALNLWSLKINDEYKEKSINVAFLELSNLIDVTVGSLQQTFADDIKKDIANYELAFMESGNVDFEIVLGELTKELHDLSELAFTEIKENLSSESLDVVRSIHGDVDNYIKNAIETKVRELKR